MLLTELQPGADGPQILAADALYQLGRVEEAHRLLLALGAASQRAPVLARLALLQLNRGFMYDANQVRSNVAVGSAGAQICLSNTFSTHCSRSHT